MSGLSFEEALALRQNFVGRACQLHYEADPVKMCKGSMQYLYDDKGDEFLDCVSNVCQVGHCQPDVVASGRDEMFNSSFSSSADGLEVSLYSKKLLATFPPELSVCFFVNSGSEANDLALRMARELTRADAVCCIDNSYHGNVSSSMDVSPLKLKRLGVDKNDDVIILPCPDVYRGVFQEGRDPDPVGSYLDASERLLQEATNKGHRIAALISEALLSFAGMIIPPGDYLYRLYMLIRRYGGLCIADEIQTGLGRCGTAWWGFQTQGVFPDFVTIGKPIGNGYPMAAVITTQHIARRFRLLDPDLAQYGSNPLVCAIGLAVLNVIEKEKYLLHARTLGRVLLDGFRALQQKHRLIGDVRGIGLWIGVEMVSDRLRKTPSKEVAELLAYRLKERRVIIGFDGPDRNVMTITPPLCFSTENAYGLVSLFGELLTEIEDDIDSGRPMAINPSAIYSAFGSRQQMLLEDILVDRTFPGEEQPQVLNSIHDLQELD